MRDLVRVPESHSLLQGDQALHADTVQATGHGAVLHAWVSVRGPQLAPGETTVLDRDLEPPLQSASHVLQAPHSDRTHWELQGVVLHVWDSCRLGHTLPPPLLGVTTARVRVDVPPPQVLEQEENSVQGPTTQSTGLPPSVEQAWVLHSSTDTRLLQMR